MNITSNMIFFVVSLLIISGIVVYTLGESIKRLRIHVYGLRLEMEKCRKAFERQERHKRKMLYQQKEAYLKLPISQREKEML